MVCWERPFGWLLGYGVLFDPVLQAGMESVPEFSCGAPEKLEPDVFYITSGGEATREFHPENVSGLFLCPDNGKPERISLKERLKTPCGQFFLPPDFPYTDAVGNDPDWCLGERSILFRKKDRRELYIELFFMINYMGFECPDRHLLIAADLLSGMLPEIRSGGTEIFSDEFRLDCQSYGICRIFLRRLFRLIRADQDQIRAADKFYLDAIRLCRSGNPQPAEEALKKAFCELYNIRTKHIPLDLRISEYPHAGVLFPESGFFELEWPEGSRKDISVHLDHAERHGYKTSLELSAGDWSQLDKMYPGMISRIRKLWDSGKIELTNGTQSLPYAFISPLCLQFFQFRNGHETFRSVFGKVPELYQCQENSFTPQMPELLSYFGYKGVLHFSLNHGSPDCESVPQITWESPSGTGLPALTCSAAEQFRSGYYFFSNLPLFMLKYRDRKSLNLFNLMDLGYIPFRENMIRASRFAPVFGRFVLGSSLLDHKIPGPKKSYTSDNYNFSAESFYKKYTNKNALSHFAHLFRLVSEFRALQLLGNKDLFARWDIISRLCLLEAHDARVQGQRPGEFYYRRTNESSPASRRELSELLVKIRADLQKRFDEIYAETVPVKTAKVFNSAEVPLTFAEVRHAEKYDGNTFDFCGRKYLSGTFPPLALSDAPGEINRKCPETSLNSGILGDWHVAVEEHGVVIKKGKKCSVFSPVDSSQGAFRCDSSVFHADDNWLTAQLTFSRKAPAAEILILGGITSKDADYIEWTIRYSGRNTFSMSDRWEDFLGLSFETNPEAKLQNYVPAMMAETKEDKIMSSYCLNVGNAYSLLFEGVGNFRRRQDRLFWLLHVANETEWERKIIVSFDDNSPALLSRGYFTGLYPALEQTVRFFEEINGNFSLECQIAPDQWLISNATDQKKQISLPSGCSVKSMDGADLKGNTLGPWQIGILIH